MSQLPSPPGLPPPSQAAASWALAQHAVWACGCALALVALHVRRSAKPGRLLKLFSVYLVCHVASSLLNLAAVAQSDSLSPAAATALGLLSAELVLVAAFTYVGIGTVLMALPKAPRLSQRAGPALGAVAVTCALALLVLRLAASALAATLLLFSVYLVEALWAYAALVVLFRRRRGAWQVRLFVASGTIGMVDFLLPALDFLAPGSVWRADFLGRALDVACYLPGAVLCLRWLESAAAAPGGGQWQPEAGSGSILGREKG